MLGQFAQFGSHPWQFRSHPTVQPTRSYYLGQFGSHPDLSHTLASLGHTVTAFAYSVATVYITTDGTMPQPVNSGRRQDGLSGHSGSDWDRGGGGGTIDPRPREVRLRCLSSDRHPPPPCNPAERLACFCGTTHHPKFRTLTQPPSRRSSPPLCTTARHPASSRGEEVRIPTSAIPQPPARADPRPDHHERRHCRPATTIGCGCVHRRFFCLSITIAVVATIATRSPDKELIGIHPGPAAAYGQGVGARRFGRSPILS